VSAALRCCAALVLNWRCAPRTKSTLPTAALPLLTLALLFFEVALQVPACTLNPSLLRGEQCQVFGAEAELWGQIFTALLAARHSAIEHSEVAGWTSEGRTHERVRAIGGSVCGLTFELSRPAEADAGWPRKDDIHSGLERPDGSCRSGSALERGVRPHPASSRYSGGCEVE
jgi:hypothetical protein